MNIHEEDYPYSIYKRPEGDELLDAHNDIIAVFDPHTELEIERLIAAAPEMLELLRETKHTLLVIYHQLWARNMGDFGAREQADKINTFLSRIETGGME